MPARKDTFFERWAEEVPGTLRSLAANPLITDYFAKIVTTNTPTFPFLSLPPELRNMIYEFTIGGHIILMKTVMVLCVQGTPATPSKRKPPRYEHLPTFNLEKPSANPGDVILARDGPNETNNSSIAYPQGVSKLFILGLVCRQIAAETDMIVYKSNIFAFRHIQLMDGGINEVSAKQWAAVTEVAFLGCCTLTDLMNGWRGKSGRHFPLRKRFRSLKRVYVHQASISRPKEQWSAWMENLARWMRSLGNGMDSGLEIILADPRNMAVNIRDDGIIKVTV